MYPNQNENSLDGTQFPLNLKMRRVKVQNWVNVLVADQGFSKAKETMKKLNNKKIKLEEDENSLGEPSSPEDVYNDDIKRENQWELENECVSHLLNSQGRPPLSKLERLEKELEIMSSGVGK